MHKLLLAAVSVAGLLIGAAGSAQAQSSCHDGNNRYMTVKNHSGYTAVTIRIRPAGRGSYSHDLLGSDVIDPGQSMDVNFDDGRCSCLVDIQVTGRPWVFTRDVCRDARLILN
jgi:hypothetical protein